MVIDGARLWVATNERWSLVTDVAQALAPTVVVLGLEVCVRVVVRTLENCLVCWNSQKMDRED